MKASDSLMGHVWGKAVYVMGPEYIRRSRGLMECVSSAFYIQRSPLASLFSVLYQRAGIGGARMITGFVY
jgi:hypothetical protein